MIQFKNYVMASSLEEAFSLNLKKANRVLGGTLWMKMSRANAQTAIDLSALGLNQIEETAEDFRIGAMVTLRQLEMHPGLSGFTQGAVKEALQHIVGVQFRNLATIGGSICGRFGFSDVITLLLALDTELEFYQKGRISLADFLETPRDRDILSYIHVKKTPRRICYFSVRNTTTDFPTLTLAASGTESDPYATIRFSIGARPFCAHVYTDKTQILSGEPDLQTASALGSYLASVVPVGSNLRGSVAYRSHLIEVLSVRAIQALGGR